MRGLGRMVLISSSPIAALACQGCMQGGTSYAPITTPPAQVYEVTVALPEAAPSLSYQGSVTRTETVAQNIVRSTQPLTGPLNVTVGSPFVATRLFASEALTGFAADRTKDRFTTLARDQRNLNAQFEVSAGKEQTGLGFDVGIAPRVTLKRDGDFATQRVGGEVRVGQNFDRRGEGDANSAWYLFAGADGEALVWEPTSAGNVSVSDMALRDKITVGDLQAGVTFQQGGGQLSVSYIRREVEYRERNMGASENEDFAGVSFTLRR